MSSIRTETTLQTRPFIANMSEIHRKKDNPGIFQQKGGPLVSTQALIFQVTDNGLLSPLGQGLGGESRMGECGVIDVEPVSVMKAKTTICQHSY